VQGAFAAQFFELAAGAAHGFFGFFEFACERVAPARVPFHLGAHLVHLRPHGLEVGFRLRRGGFVRRRGTGQRKDERQAQRPAEGRHGHILGFWSAENRRKHARPL